MYNKFIYNFIYKYYITFSYFINITNVSKFIYTLFNIQSFNKLCFKSCNFLHLILLYLNKLYFIPVIPSFFSCVY